METPRLIRGDAARTSAGGRLRCLARLTRGEGAAAEALRSILDRIPSPSLRVSLEILWRDHVEAAQLLAARLGEEAAGAVSASWTPVSAGARPRPAMEALHAAESAWARVYERALLGGDLDPSDGALVLSILLPRQRAHPPLLERVLASA